MDRREFMRQTLAATASTWLSGCGRDSPSSDESDAAPATAPTPSPSPPADPEPPTPPRGGGELDGDFPDWTLGNESSSPNTVLMFRGNPTHTFYGTGPLATQPQL